MSLTTRVKRLIKSDMHALVEGLEEPRWVLAQALRDMEEDLGKIESELGARRAQIDRIKDRLLSGQAVVSALENDIEFAMEEKREAIAKRLIRKLLVTRKNLEDLTTRGTSLEEDLVTVEEEFRVKKGAYEDIRGRCEVLNLTRPNEEAFTEPLRVVPDETPADSTLAHQVELEFLRRLQKQKEGTHASS